MIFDGCYSPEHIYCNDLCSIPEVSKITLSTPSVEDRFSNMSISLQRLLPVTVLLVACLGMILNQDLAGQSGTVTVDENFRAGPNGALLGQIYAGTDLNVVNVEGDWLQVEVVGWVWNQSLQITGNNDFDLVVSASGGENIRFAPSERVIGRLEKGTLLQEMKDSVSGWSRVYRSVWIWSKSVDIGGSNFKSYSLTKDSKKEELWTSSVDTEGSILSTPDGDTLAALLPGSNLKIIKREGNWARIRLDGWMWLPEHTEEGNHSTVDTDVTPEDVTNSPLEYRGRVVGWDLQFISLERADKLRADFYEGESFLLTRIDNEKGTFVYVAIPPERVHEAEGLIPLEYIRVIGRIRTGSTILTRNPVIELLDISVIPE